MSQKELAEGICKQGQISRLENGEYTPGADFLYALSRKLKVSMDYFFEEQVEQKTDELTDFKKLAHIFIMNRNYESLKYIFELENIKTHRLSLSDKLYMEWIRTLVDFYFYGKKDEAVIKLEGVLEQLSASDLNYLQFSNTLFNFYYEVGSIERFNKIRDRLEERVNQLSLNTVEEVELSIKFNYNVCRYLWLQKDIEQAISRIATTIRQCKDYKTTYLLADLYVLMGNISKNISSKSITLENYEVARFLYKLDENIPMMLKVEQYILKLKE